MVVYETVVTSEPASRRRSNRTAASFFSRASASYGMDSKILRYLGSTNIVYVCPFPSARAKAGCTKRHVMAWEWSASQTLFNKLTHLIKLRKL